MMKAAVVTSFTEPLQIQQVERPKPAPNDVLIRTIACGVCHSDLHIAKGGETHGLIKRKSMFGFFFSIS